MTRLSFNEKAGRKLTRLTKVLRHATIAAVRGVPRTRPVFIFGMQRSGTRIPLAVADRSRNIMAYGEGAEGYYRNVMLGDFPTVERSLADSPFSMVMLKPICDSHRADEILDRFPESRGLWIFRDYRDTVASAAAKWPSAPDGIKKLADEDVQSAGWWAGGLEAADFELVRRHFSTAMTPVEAHALLWYLRNAFYFRLRLNERADVLLIRYEDLVKEPKLRFAQVFRFLDVEFQEKYVTDIHSSSVAANRNLELSAGIDRLCSDLHTKLMMTYRTQSSEPTIADQVSSD